MNEIVENYVAVVQIFRVSVRLTNCFPPTIVLIELQRLINSNIETLQSRSAPKALMGEIKLLFCYIFCLGVFQRSATQALSNPDWFPGVHKVIEELIGHNYEKRRNG
jgi:hypothetical protein